MALVVRLAYREPSFRDPFPPAHQCTIARGLPRAACDWVRSLDGLSVRRIHAVLHMNFDHHTVRSPVFECIATYEIDVAFGDEEFPTRIELFRDVSEPTGYRAYIWQLEMYRIQSTFPRDESGRVPLDGPSDEGLLIERTHLAKPDLSYFRATSDEEAREHVVSSLRQFLDHAFGPAPSAGGPDIQPDATD